MLEGVHTAIITPFRDDEQQSVDFGALEKLVAFQIDNGVNGIVPVGTTGESPTLDFDEHHAVIECVVKAAAGRVKVIAGTGGNSTREALELTEHAKAAGADATLQVTPYYNRPTARGLIDHFARLADVGLPTMLYHVPGRTGLPIGLDVVRELANHPQVVAIKEAGGDVNRVNRILDTCDIEVLSGDDPLTLPMMICGAVGVVSVASNIIPAAVSNMVSCARQGMWDEAAAIHRQYVRFFNGMFTETNPIPVKTAAARMGLCQLQLRPPMSEMGSESLTQLEQLLNDFNLLS